jgi:hypothetical protein
MRFFAAGRGLHRGGDRGSEELVNIAEIAVPARGPFVPQEVFLADERHLDAAVSSPNRIGTGIREVDAGDSIQKIDSDRFDTDRKHRIGPAERLEGHGSGLKPELDEGGLEASQVVGLIRKEHVDVFGESRKAVIRDGVSPDDHVVNAMNLEQP